MRVELYDSSLPNDTYDYDGTATQGNSPDYDYGGTLQNLLAECAHEVMRLADTVAYHHLLQK